METTYAPPTHDRQLPHIALLRSMVINRQRLTSANARLMAEQVGATDIVTVGATGNLLFHSAKGPPGCSRS